MGGGLASSHDVVVLLLAVSLPFRRMGFVLCSSHAPIVRYDTQAHIAMTLSDAGRPGRFLEGCFLDSNPCRGNGPPLHQQNVAFRCPSVWMSVFFIVLV